MVGATCTVEQLVKINMMANTLRTLTAKHYETYPSIERANLFLLQKINAFSYESLILMSQKNGPISLLK